MNERANYRMITLARVARGYTQTDLAKAIPKLSQGNLCKIEKDALGVTDDMIGKIAEFLDFPVSFFYQQYTFPPFSQIYYRKLESVTSGNKKMAELRANFNIIMTCIDNMLDELAVPAFSIPQYDLDEGISIKDVAKRTRLKLGVPDGSIDDLAHFVEKSGVLIIEIDTDFEKFDAMTGKTQNGVVVVFLNGRMPKDRQRFTLAHELGHIIMHIPFIDIDPRRDVEKEANRFASEFLMPFSEFRSDALYLNYYKLDTLKSYWKVSKQAIIYKAKQDGIIDENKYKSLMVQLSMNGERKVERTPIQSPPPKLLKKMIDAFYNEMDFTKEDVVNITKIKLDTFPLMLFRRDKMFKLNRPRISLG